MKFVKFFHFNNMKPRTSKDSFDPFLMSFVESASYTKKTTKKHISLNFEENEEGNTKKDLYMKAFELIKEMRKNRDSPVDYLGSHLQFNKEVSKETQGFQLITSLILSVQTKDQTTDLVMKRLLDKGLNVDFIEKISVEELKNLIYEINFNNNKAKYLKKLANILKIKYDGKMPEKYEEIIELPGVGPKIAILFMQFHLNKNVGIAVDTHVHRVSNRLQWVKTSLPEQTRRKLEEIFEKNVWSDINLLLVGFGQSICLPVNPKCSECLLKDICPEGKKNLNQSFKKTKRK